MIGFIEFVVAVAVVLVAGYLIASNRDRIRGVANATVVGLSAGDALSDAGDDSGHGQSHDGHSHRAGPHWESSDPPSHHTDL